MANIAISSNNGAVLFDFGVYTQAPYKQNRLSCLSKGNIEFYISKDEGVVLITKGRNNHTFYLSTTQKDSINDRVNYMIVDLVNGITPTDIDHLMQLLFGMFN